MKICMALNRNMLSVCEVTVNSWQVIFFILLGHENVATRNQKGTKAATKIIT